MNDRPWLTTNPNAANVPSAIYPGNYDSIHRAETRDATACEANLAPSDYERLRAFVLARIGLDFPEQKRGLLERGLTQVMDALGCRNLDELYALLNAYPTTSAVWDQVIGVLTVGETYFFRNTSHFDALAKRLLPALIAARANADRRIRIWSAGCASGEEPYSLAILLKETIPNLESWNVLILATDINREALRKAQAGRYNAWSFRGVAQRVQDQYFNFDGKQYIIADEIKRMVELAYLNLASDPFPSLTNNTNAMDLILCRNVTIYFGEPTTRALVRKFHACLVNDGWLIPGPCEPNLVYYSDFTAHNFPGAVVYQKASAPKIKTRLQPASTAPPTTIPSRVTAPPPRAPIQAPPDLYQQALELLQAERADDALAMLYAKIDQDANFAPAYFTLGKIYANQGDFEQAQQWCERAIRLDQLHPEPYYTLALVYQQRGLMEPAVDALKKTIYLDREFALAHYHLAQIYRYCGEKALARRGWRNVQRLLQNQPLDQRVPAGDGLIVGRLLELVKTELELDH